MSNFNADVKPRAEIQTHVQHKPFSTPSVVDVLSLGTVGSVGLQGDQAMDLSVTQHLVHPGGDPATLDPRHLTLHTYNIESQRHCVRELDLLMHKNKNRQSAVASPQVKQRLRDLIISKQNVQAALERTSSNPSCSSTLKGYRELGRDPDMPPKPQMATPTLAPPHERPLRRTASEPILKAKPKIKKPYFRPNPLRRKTSAPPTVKHRTPEALDSSPSSSSTPVSGCSSPNDSLRSESGALPLPTGLPLEVQRLMLQDSICSSATPTITAGLPAQRLQPVLILEPNSGLVHTQLLSVPPSYNHSVLHLLSHPPSPLLTGRGMNLASSHQTPYSSSSSPSFSSSSFSRAELGGCHRPLGRTRSEPLPQSPPHLLLHSKLLMENLKENPQLRKAMTKPSEKPRLSQIPSEDPEESGPPREDAYQRRRVSMTGAELLCDAVSPRDSLEELGHLQLSLTLSQSFRWGEQSHHLQALHRQYTGHPTDPIPLAVPLLVAPQVPSLAHRPLSRAQSSPASTSLPPPPPPQPSSSTSEVGGLPLTRPASPEPPAKLGFTTGLVYDSQMLKHQCACGDNSRHPEHAGRIQSIWSRLQERGLRGQCECIRSRKATMEELQSVHTEEYVLRYGTNPLNRLKLDNRKLAGILSKRVFVTLPCGEVGVDSDTVWNETHTPTASRTAAGSVTELAFKVAQGELKNGFAVVRPPGHHALHSTPMGFCFFNSVAIAAKQLQQKLNVSKILIVDWDVHHGNSTQEVFYNDPSVLFISLHRYDNGNFFPGNGGPNEVGAGTGKGFNVNVAWTGGLDPPLGDAEYLAAFRTVVMPIAQEFSPDLVLVSAGFDAVEGHPAPLGGYRVSAKCFGFLTRQLMGLAGGRVVMALEGGYDLTAICDASEACVSALLGVETEPLSSAALDQRPCFNAVLSLQRVIQAHSEYWQSLPSLLHTVDLSWLQAQQLVQRRDSDNAVSALASLSMGSFCSDRWGETRS